jgi:hypothetical protein
MRIELRSYICRGSAAIILEPAAANGEDGDSDNIDEVEGVFTGEVNVLDCRLCCFIDGEFNALPLPPPLWLRASALDFEEEDEEDEDGGGDGGGANTLNSSARHAVFDSASTRTMSPKRASMPKCNGASGVGVSTMQHNCSTTTASLSLEAEEKGSSSVNTSNRAERIEEVKEGDAGTPRSSAPSAALRLHGHCDAGGGASAASSIES